MRLRPDEQLRALCEEFRHVRGEHAREGEHGSWRRKLHARLMQLEAQLDAQLERWIHDEDERQAWRHFMHKGGAAPETSFRDPPLFLGRSATGSVLEIRRATDDRLDALVDGSPAARLPARTRFGDAVGPVHLAGQDFVEVPEVELSALAALRAWVIAPTGEAPWHAAPALYNAGLIDEDFGLTERGRRVLTAGSGREQEVYLR